MSGRCTPRVSSVLPALSSTRHEPNEFRFAYPYDAPIEEKIRAIAQNVYGADDVFMLKTAKDKAASLDAAGLGSLRSAWRRRTSRSPTTRPC